MQKKNDRIKDRTFFFIFSLLKHFKKPTRHLLRLYKKNQFLYRGKFLILLKTALQKKSRTGKYCTGFKTITFFQDKAQEQDS